MTDLSINDECKIYGWAFTLNPSGGVQEDLQKYTQEWLEKSPFVKLWRYKIEYSKKGQRHLHGCALFEYKEDGHGKNKFNEWFRTYLASPKGDFRNKFWVENKLTGKWGNNLAAYLPKTWYKGGGWEEGYIIKDDMPDDGDSEQTRFFSENYHDIDFQQYLADHIPEDQRRKVKSKQEVIHEKFDVYELPYETCEEVATSLSSLQFKHKALPIVHERERVNLIISTWCLIHEYCGDPEDVKLDYLETIKLKRHKRKLELDSKYERAYSEQQYKKYRKWDDEIDKINETIS